MTGKYRGAAHQNCSRKHQHIFVPTFAHNFRGYDSHFIITALAHPDIQQILGGRVIEGIPTNTEKFMSLTLRGQLKFLDSIQFMPSSLDQLAKNCTSFPSLEEYFRDKSSLMHVKGIFPYEYITGFEILEETALPDHSRFYSKLSNGNVSAEEYNRTVNIFNEFSCHTIGDYMDLYLIQDTLLLDDILRAFRNSAIVGYKLDPCWYVSSPGLAWDAMIARTKVELHLLTELDKYQFIENGIGGGISVITKKISTANNKYIPGFDCNAPVKYLTYLDTNNVYGSAMSKAMPYRCGLWYSEEGFRSITENMTKDLSDADYSFFVEFDAEYPASLHDAHNDYPYLSVKMVVEDSQLSPAQLANRTGKPTLTEKLVPVLLPRRGYICHYRVLHQAVQAGLVVTKVHRALKFYQSKWLADYIKFNMDMRSKATNDFEKDFYKLMNNSVFGKTMENVRNRCNIDLVNGYTKRFSKLIAANSFAGTIPISGDLVFVKKHKTDILLNKPVYVGASVLDISKWLMYDFHYGFIKQQYPNARLCFSDTDSLLYEIPGEDCNNDLYASIYEHRSLFDLSDVRSKYNDNTNKKVIGKFKDELCFEPIVEFTGLRPKMYSVLALNTASGSTINMMKAKGVKKTHREKEFQP